MTNISKGGCLLLFFMATQQHHFALQTLLELVDDHRSHNHQTFDYHLPEIADAHHHHAIRQEDDNESANNRAGNPATSARQRRAAQHGGTNGIHLKHVAGHRVRSLQLRGHHQPDESGAEAGKGVDKNFHLDNRHARQSRGGLIAANGVDITTQRGFARQVEAEQ